MNDLETHPRPPSGDVRGKPALATGLGTGLGHCLIVSSAQSKRDMISLAASEAGWETIVCVDEPQAMAVIRRTHLQMAWVDLESPTHAETSRELCQAIAALSNVLLVVCGHENDPQEEIWARKYGAWLYLPGLSLAHSSEVQLVCEQAQLIAGGSRSRL
jgi:hypothetical protein